LSTSFAFAQNSNAELDSLIVKGINNKGLKASQLQVDKYEANIKVLIHLKTNIYYNYDENNLAPIINS
jgi:cobalt-zinc-cadmium resistance protein CzcA